MLGLCFAFENDAKRRDYWSWINSWYSIDSCWERNRPDDFGNYYSHFQPDNIADISPLPTEPRLVVMTAADADYVKGTQSLYDFQHPESAIYYFGRDGGKIKPEDLEGRDHDRVFIPVDAFDMYASHAAAVAFYDRRQKQHAGTG